MFQTTNQLMITIPVLVENSRGFQMPQEPSIFQNRWLLSRDTTWESENGVYATHIRPHNCRFEWDYNYTYIYILFIILIYFRHMLIFINLYVYMFIQLYIYIHIYIILHLGVVPTWPLTTPLQLLLKVLLIRHGFQDTQQLPWRHTRRPGRSKCLGRLRRLGHVELLEFSWIWGPVNC